MSVAALIDAEDGELGFAAVEREGSVIGGIRDVTVGPQLKTTLVVVFVVFASGSTSLVSLPVVAAAVFPHGAGGLGRLTTILAIGSVISATLATRQPRPDRSGILGVALREALRRAVRPSVFGGGGHGRAYFAASALGLGVTGAAVSATAVLSVGMPGIAPAMPAAVAVGGFAAGLVVLGPSWSRFDRRWVAAAMLLGNAAGYGLFATATGWLPLAAGALLLWMTASAWVGIFDRFAELNEGGARRSSLLILVGSGVTVLVLDGQTRLAHHLSAGAAALATVGLAAVTAAELWWTTPKDDPNRVRMNMREVVKGPIGILTGPRTRRVVAPTALLLGFSVTTVGAFEVSYRAALPNGVPSWLTSLLVTGMFVGGGWPAIHARLEELIDKIAVKARRRAAHRQGLIDRAPDRYLRQMGVTMVVGAAVLAVTASMGGTASVVGIVVFAFAAEAAANGIFVAVNTRFRRDLPEHMVGPSLGAVVFARFGVQVPGLWFVSRLWQHDGWPVVSGLIAGTAGVTLLLIAALTRRPGDDNGE